MIRLLIALSLLSPVAYACGCPPTPTCGAFSAGAQFFTGDVVGQRKVPSEHAGQVDFVDYSVRVMESFTPNVAVGSTAHVWSDPSSGCSWDFNVGSAYLFEAHPDGARLYTSSCTFTAELDKAKPVLAQLRAVKAGSRPPSLVGTLSQQVRGRQGGLGQVAVTARSSSGATYTATTDTDGVFRFDTLAPGSYTLAPRLPAWLQLINKATDSNNPSRIPVPPGTGAEASCRAYLSAAKR